MNDIDKKVFTVYEEHQNDRYIEFVSLQEFLYHRVLRIFAVNQLLLFLIRVLSVI